MSSSDEHRVAICVVTHNCESDVEDFVAAVEKIDYRPLELVIVDSGSQDATVERFETLVEALPTTIEALSKNVGYAAAMNRALELTRAPWVLALNADTRPEADFVGALLDRASRHPDFKVGAVTGRLTRLDAAQRIDAAGMYLTVGWRHHDRGSGDADTGQLSRAERVFGATGAAVLLRREALDDVAVQGEAFASEFHSFREDAELAFRLRERGWEILYEPAAKALHRRFNTPKRRREMPARVNYHSLKNRYLLRAYHQSLGNLLVTLVPTVARDLGALVYVLLFERSSLPAYRWLWSSRRMILERRRQLRARRSVPQSEINQWFWHRRRPL